MLIPDGMTLPTATQPSLSDGVLKILRDMISTGQLAPGMHLKEAELALALGVSRGPIREAFTRLQAEGQVELRRHRGAFVSQLTRVDVEELHSLRTVIEGLAAERACTRMTPADFVAMDDVLARMKDASPTIPPEEAVRLDLAFHDLIYAAAQHQRLHRVWTSIRSGVSFLLHTRNVHFPDFVQVGHREHQVVRDALSGGDPALARAAAEHHIVCAYERLALLPLPEGTETRSPS